MSPGKNSSAAKPLLLCENCRNTRTIFDGFMKFYQGEATPEPIGPAGRPVEVLDHASESGELPGVTRVLRRLLKEEQIPANAITILTPRAQSKSLERGDSYRSHGSSLLEIEFHARRDLMCQYPYFQGIGEQCGCRDGGK